MKTLSFVLPLTLAALAIACSDASTSASEGTDTPAPEETEQPAKKPATNKPGASSTDPSSTTETPAESPAQTSTTGTAIATAKIREGVRAYAASNDALWIATDKTVEKTAADGSGAIPLGAFGPTKSLTLSEARVFGLVDKGNFYEVFSTKPDGTEGTHHLNWLKSNGEPDQLVLDGERIYFSVTAAEATQSKIMSASATPPLTGNAPYRTEELVDAKSVAPVFAEGRLFAVDHVRQSAVRVSLTDASVSVDFIQDSVPLTAGGIALQGTDVYTRTAKGIVKAPTTAAANATPTVVVAATACPVFDEATGAASVLDDALVVDGSTIYAACRSGANVEVRAFALDGKPTKTVATVPYGAGLSHLHITSTAAYWLSRPTATTTELWRAAK